MGFVNINGEPIKLDKLMTPKRAKAKAVTEPKHKGFKVVGFSKEQINEAMAEHRRKADSFKNIHGYEPAPFDKAVWMHTARRLKISGKPIATYEAAAEQAKLAERYGWESVDVVALTTGVK